MIGVCYVAELFYAHPDLGDGRPSTRSCRSSRAASRVLLAVGILGATVMPHVIYLHSALTQDRIVPENDEEARRLMRYTRVDVIIAMTIAGLINMAMLVMAASTFFGKRPARRRLARERAQDARADPRQRVGALFALALLGSGLSRPRSARSPGQVVMQGFVRRRIPICGAPARDDGAGVRRRRDRRRPVAHARDQPGRALVRDPVRAGAARDVHGRRDLMGALVNRRVTTAAAVGRRGGDHLR